MVYTIIPLTLILLGLAIVLWILIRHFPQIALLDVEALPAEQQARTKKSLLEGRYKQSMDELREKVGDVLEPVGGLWKKFQKTFREKVTHTYTQYKRTTVTSARTNKKKDPPPPEAIAALLKDAETALLSSQYEEAEHRYIEVIRLAPRNIEAYRGLGRLYFEMEHWKEAEEIYLYIVKLDPRDTRALNRLGMIAMEREQWNDAVRYFKRTVEVEGDIAVRYYDLSSAYLKLEKFDLAIQAFEKVMELEPHNPKYLDAFLELALDRKDATRATEIFNHLKMANPDNQKLEEFGRRIDGLRDV